MTIVRSDIPPVASNQSELTSLQFQQTSSFLFAADPSPASSTTPSPFELLFSRQLGQSFETAPTANDGASASVDVRGGGPTQNSFDLPELKTKSVPNDDGTGFTPLVNPLTMALFAVPLPTIFDIFTASAGTATTAAAKQDETGTASTENTVLSSESQSLESASSAAETVDQSVGEEELSSDSGFYSNILAHQSTNSPSRIVLPQLTSSQQAVTSNGEAEKRSGSDSTTPDSSGFETQLTVAARVTLISSDRGSIVGDSHVDDGHVKITSMNSTGPTQHVDKLVDPTIAANAMIIPMTNFGSAVNLLPGTLLTEQLAATIKEQLEDESNEGSTSIRMQLDHPELGLIELYLSIANNVVSMRIVSKNPQSKRMIESQMDDLRQTLSNSGVTCGEFLVSGESSRQPFSEPEESTPQTMATKLPASARWARTQMTPTVSATANSQLNVVA